MKTNGRSSSCGIIALFFWAATPVVAQDLKLETEEQKTIYALGLSLSDSVARYELTEEELKALQAGLADGVLGRERRVNVNEYRVKLRDLAKDRMAAAAEVEKKASAEFLTQAAAEKGAVKTDSGLIYVELKPGDGPTPKATDTVKVHYHGTLRDGSVFDSSVERGSPATFPLNRVISCWTEGLQRIKVGGKSKLICPSNIAYGDRGAPPKIKPGAALIFEVELLSIEEKKASMGHP